MTGNAEDAAADAPAEGETDTPLWERAWHAVVAAGRWVVDTFRGYSGAQALRDRER